ncbi:MAG: DUF294 nucleotidyltransferase-like domain-containing protein [Cellvibrionaceae bacterium]
MDKTRLTPELIGIRDFLKKCLPFENFTISELDSIIPNIKITYYKKNHTFTHENCESGLYIIRSGAIEINKNKHELIDRFDEGSSFHLPSLLANSYLSAAFIEDTLVYYIEDEVFSDLCAQHLFFKHFYRQKKSDSLTFDPSQIKNIMADNLEATKKIQDLMSSEVYTASPHTSIQQIAIEMSEKRVSSVLIIHEETIVGIATDRDIRSRTVATGLDTSTRIDAIMTPSPKTLQAEATLFDGMLMMIKEKIHHAPVIKNEKVVGIITTSDLIFSRQNEPVYFIKHLSKQKSLENLKKLTQNIPQLLKQWAHQNLQAEQMGKILTSISDTVTQRLITLAIEDLGNPPVPFCWLGFGSQGRQEQLLGGDQDNGLLISDDLKESDKAWFEALSRRVCDGLNTCGYIYCNGKIMATTKEWRQPLASWKKTVSNWTQNPDQDAVMRVSIFFDIRSIYGDINLCSELQQHMLNSVFNDTIFLGALAGTVLDTPPPLGFFRSFVVEHTGEHRHQLNLKKSAIIPLVDIIRIYALANKIEAVNTLERINALEEKGTMAKVDCQNLRDAFTIILQIRLESQVEQVSSGSDINNYIDPKKLTTLQKKQIKDALSIVAGTQRAVKANFLPGL